MPNDNRKASSNSNDKRKASSNSNDKNRKVSTNSNNEPKKDKVVIKSRINSNPPRAAKGRVMSNPPRQAGGPGTTPQEGKKYANVKARINTKGADVHRHSKESEECLQKRLKDRDIMDKKRAEARKRMQARIYGKQQLQAGAKGQPAARAQLLQLQQAGDAKGRKGGKTKGKDIDLENLNAEERLEYLKAQEWDEEPNKTRIGRFCQCCRKKWRWLQGYYPPRGGAPAQPPPLYVPPNATIKDTGWARQLKAAMDIRVIRYPEPFSELLLTSNYLEPKNYKIMVNHKALFYSYDYTPYIDNLSRYIQPFSQIILDPDDNVIIYQECFKFPNEVMCCIACLDCRKIQIRRNQVVYYMRAPNGCYMGKIERNRPCAKCHCTTYSFNIYNRKDELILFVSRKNARKFYIKSVSGKKTRIGVIRRRLVPDSNAQLFPNYYDYKILLDSHDHNLVETKFLIIGVTFFIVSFAFGWELQWKRDITDLTVKSNQQYQVAKARYIGKKV